MKLNGKMIFSKDEVDRFPEEAEVIGPLKKQVGEKAAK